MRYMQKHSNLKMYYLINLKLHLIDLYHIPVHIFPQSLTNPIVQ